MSRYISEILIKEVLRRAGGRCEYCRIFIEDTYFGGEIDHIRSLKHRGHMELRNLALACQPCNRGKGSDLGSISERSGALVRFFDPRIDIWREHFLINSVAEIEALSDIGEVTALILGFNASERIAERKGLIEMGRFG